MTRHSSPSATASSRLRNCGRAFAAACLHAPVRERRRLLALVLLPFAVPGRPADVPLPGMLDQIGQQEERFWSYFPSVTCTESVTQTKLGSKDKSLFVHRQTFDYLIGLQASGLDIQVDESRLQKTRSGSKANVALLETNGFSIFSLMFHPLYQSRYEFTPLADQSTSDQRLLCLGFRQVGTDHPLSVLRVRDKEYPLAWRGKAWIDANTWAVVRVQAGLGDSMEYLGLLRLDVDVTYSEVRFSDSTAYELPARAVIDAETKRQHWRNTHVFTDYRRFAVATDEKVEGPKK